MLTMYCLLVTEIMTVPIFSVNMFPYNSMNVALYGKADCSGGSQQRIGVEQVTFPSFVICFIEFVDVSSKDMVRKFQNNFRTSTPPLSLLKMFFTLFAAQWKWQNG